MSLQSLYYYDFICIAFRVNPITWAGQEVLLLPVGQEDETASSTTDIFHELYSDDTVDMDEEGTFL